MQCFTCQRLVAATRLVRLRMRGSLAATPARPVRARSRRAGGGRESGHVRIHAARREDGRFRPAFVCEGCYTALELLERIGRTEAPYLSLKYELAGRSRRGRARVFDAARYARYQRRLAGRLGILLE